MIMTLSDFQLFRFIRYWIFYWPSFCANFARWKVHRARWTMIQWNMRWAFIKRSIRCRFAELAIPFLTTELWFDITYKAFYHSNAARDEQICLESVQEHCEKSSSEKYFEAPHKPLALAFSGLTFVWYILPISVLFHRWPGGRRHILISLLSKLSGHSIPGTYGSVKREGNMSFKLT